MSPSNFPTRHVLNYSGLEGEVIGLKEVPSRPTRTTIKLASLGGSDNSRTSGGITSLTRSSASSAAFHGSAASFVRGKVGHSMFVPGGLEDEAIDSERENQSPGTEVGHDAIERQVAAIEAEISKGIGLHRLPPGFRRAYKKGGNTYEKEENDHENLEKVAEDFTGLRIDDVSQGLNNVHRQKDERPPEEKVTSQEKFSELDKEIDDLLPAKKPSVGDHSSRREVDAKREWAHVVDVNRKITNFQDLVPDMAHEVSKLN